MASAAKGRSAGTEAGSPPEAGDHKIAYLVLHIADE
jgi:hypothetical protein